jgi:cytochrome oxidase Cu insertion factor (SCO1/SenC/PrrC family)
MARLTRLVDGAARFFGGPAFPTFAVALLVLYEGALVALALAPPSETGLGAFAADFRVWCLSADPATGRTNWGYAAGMMAPPLLVAVSIVALWWRPLTALGARPVAAVRPSLAAAAIVAAGAALAGLAAPQPVRGELPFPAEALRTAYAPPPLRLTDQAGATVDLAALRGRVVLLTAIYTRCVHTCPAAMAQARSVVASLSPAERSGLSVVAVTLDPANDDQAVLATLAAVQDLQPPLWHLVTGEPAAVERTLDLMNVARTRNPATNDIDHANLFLLVDRQGRLAYRFTLGSQQARWLTTAVRLLLGERDRA